MKLFSRKTENIAWSVLENETDLEVAIKHSYSQPIAIFKHSIRCGISSMVKYNLERAWDIDPTEVKPYYLDLINYRSVSNLIAEKLGVPHQSPQIILLKDGEVLHHTSHQAISASKVKDALAA